MPGGALPQADTCANSPAQQDAPAPQRPASPPTRVQAPAPQPWPPWIPASHPPTAEQFGLLRNRTPCGSLLCFPRAQATPPSDSEVMDQRCLPPNPTSPLWARLPVGVGLGLEKTCLGARGLCFLPAHVTVWPRTPRLSPRGQDGTRLRGGGKAVPGCRSEGREPSWSRPCRQRQRGQGSGSDADDGVSGLGAGSGITVTLSS